MLKGKIRTDTDPEIKECCPEPRLLQYWPLPVILYCAAPAVCKSNTAEKMRNVVTGMRKRRWDGGVCKNNVNEICISRTFGELCVGCSSNNKNTAERVGKCAETTCTFCLSSLRYAQQIEQQHYCVKQLRSCHCHWFLEVRINT